MRVPIPGYVLEKKEKFIRKFITSLCFFWLLFFFSLAGESYVSPLFLLVRKSLVFIEWTRDNERREMEQR